MKLRTFWKFWCACINEQNQSHLPLIDRFGVDLNLSNESLASTCKVAVPENATVSDTAVYKTRRKLKIPENAIMESSHNINKE